MSLHSPKAFDKMDYWIFSMNKNFFLQKLSAVTKQKVEKVHKSGSHFENGKKTGWEIL